MKKTKKRSTLGERLNEAFDNGYSAGYAQGAEHARNRLADDSRAVEKARADLALKVFDAGNRALSSMGQTLDSMNQAIRTVLLGGRS